MGLQDCLHYQLGDCHALIEGHERDFHPDPENFEFEKGFLDQNMLDLLHINSFFLSNVIFELEA